MSKLLSDEELRSAIAKAAEFSRSDGWYFDKVGGQLNATHKVEALEALFNTQKRLYAEMVVGEYPKNAHRKNISDVMAEQRARIK